MMNTPVDEAVYRVLRTYRKEGKPKGYQYTLEVIDDHTQKVVASCDIKGRPVFSVLEIMDDRHQEWVMTPNRKIMPSRWIVRDPKQRVAMQFDQRILGKLANPLSKVGLGLLDGNGEEIYRLIDPRAGHLDPLFLNPDEWVVTDGSKPVAKIVQLPRQKQQSQGFVGVLRAKRPSPTLDSGLASFPRIL